VPLAFWPLPAPDMLEQFRRDSQLQYWANAATHFDQNDWLDRAPVWVEKVTPGRATTPRRRSSRAMAAETLALDHRVRVAVPLEADQLRIADAGPAAPRRRRPPPPHGGASATAPTAAPSADLPATLPATAPATTTAPAPPAPQLALNDPAEAAQLLDPASTSRVWSAAPALVFAPPMRLWPEAAATPMQYLRSDMPALVPYVGAGGDERDVRLWAWLAFLRQATLINFADALPSLDDPTDPADPNELIWFYPGEWFGLDQPVPTIQLKWLRRAQQDYEYLRLARERGDRDTRLTTLLMARLITKPVEIPLGQNPDPAYALMSGTTSQDAWTEAQRLLTNMILLHPPGRPSTPCASTRSTSKRSAGPSRRSARCSWGARPGGSATSTPKRPSCASASASTCTTRPTRRSGPTSSAGARCRGSRGGRSTPSRPTRRCCRRTMCGGPCSTRRSTSTRSPPAARRPMELTFTNGFDRRTASLKVALPVATSDRREGRPLPIDGRIEDDWNPADLVHSGPLVRMLSRPGLQRQRLEPASTPAKVYTTWAAGHFYVAFDLAGINPGALGRARNFVDYQFRRAWGEDLCEILIQPLDASGLPGAVLHVVCKPNGSTWVERKDPPAAGADAAAAAPGGAWKEVQAGILHESRTDGDRWRGEVKIPWKAILNAAAGERGEPPVLLRFNFAQHRTTTGESASWAGPVDFGRDDNFMGVLYLRDPEEPGPRNLAGRAGSAAAAVPPAATRRPKNAKRRDLPPPAVLESTPPHPVSGRAQHAGRRGSGKPRGAPRARQSPAPAPRHARHVTPVTRTADASNSSAAAGHKPFDIAPPADNVPPDHFSCWG
jgi:hypothetical protein